MKGLLSGSLLTLILALITPSLSQADVVHFKNGDRLTGTIIKLEDGDLELKTDHVDRVFIEWKYIKSITSKKPLSLVFHDNAVIPSDYGVRDGDRLIVLTLEAGIKGSQTICDRDNF